MQLLWADDGRSSLQTCAYYLNSCISEVESAAEIYLQFFPAIEIIAHFLFSIVMILAVFPLAAPLVFVLAPIVFFVQKLRAPELSRLLVTKQKCERNCVALLSVSSLLFLFHVILYACMFLCVPTIQVASLLGKIVLAQEFKL